MEFKHPWKYLSSRDDFWRTLYVCREYCASDRFVAPPFASYFVCTLSTIEAWCADGRTPNYSERQHNRMGWVISREITEAGVPREGEWAEMAGRIIEVGSYFEYWPTDDQVRDEVAFWNAKTMLSPRTPKLEEVRAGAHAIESALRGAGRWSSEPLPPEKRQFTAAFGADTMSPTEWLQFVFLPRIARCIAGSSPLPETSALTYLGSNLSSDRANWPVMYALSDFDHLFVAPQLIDNVKRWPLIMKESSGSR